MDEEQGITALGPEDLNTEQKVSSFPQFTDEAKATRGIEDFKKFKKGFKQALPYLTQGIIEFAPGVDVLDVLGKKPDVITDKKFDDSPSERFVSGIKNIKEGEKTKGITEALDAGLTYLGATGDVALASTPVTGLGGLVAYGALKGIAKGGKVVMETKLGQKFLASLEKQ